MGHFDNCSLRLHDCAISGYTRSAASIIVSIRKWDESALTITFYDVVFFREQTGDDDLEGLFEQRASTLTDQVGERLRALRWSDEEIRQLRHFQLVDLSNFPVIDIVGKRWEQAG